MRLSGVRRLVGPLRENFTLDFSVNDGSFVDPSSKFRDFDIFVAGGADLESRLCHNKLLLLFADDVAVPGVEKSPL
jgi:hypothetical protein